MLRFLLLSWIFYALVFPVRVGAQADSLLVLVQTLPDGEEKVNAYKDLAFANYNNDPDLSLRYCDTLEQVAKRSNLPRLVVKAEYLRAIVRWTRGDNDRAVAHCLRGLEIMGEPRDEAERVNLATLNNLLGSIYVNQGLFEEGAGMLIDAAQLSLENQDSQGYAYSLINVSTALKKHGDNASAREHTQRAIEVLHVLGEDANLVTAYNNLASYTDDPEEGIAYLEKAEYHGAISGNRFQLTHTYHNYVRPLVATGRVLEALAYERRAYRQAREYDNVQLQIGTAIGLGQLQDTLGRRDSAMYLLREGISLAETTDLTAIIQTAYLDLAELYRGRKQLDSAYYYLMRQLSLQDSLHQKNITEQFAASNARFGVVERDRQIAEQELEIIRQEARRNRLLLGGLALLLFLAALFSYFFQRNRLRRRALALEVEKQEAEAHRLRELDGIKTRFFTNISHELRTPLTLITSPLEEAISRLKQVNLKPDLELAHRNSRNLLTLVNEILDLSKLEAGQLAKNEVTFAPEALLRRLFHTFESLADLRGVSLRYQGDFPAEERLITDVGKFEKIINNLMSNALKFSPEGGTVQCSAVRADNTLSITVSDQGPGIEPLELERVFDRYYQSAANAEHQTGTGIGLNLSRKLARYLGGDITVESRVGEGSSFTLRLPVVRSLPSSPLGKGALALGNKKNSTIDSVPGTTSGEHKVADVAIIPPWQPASGRARLLLVEDNAEMSNYLTRHLSTHYDVTAVPNGRTALAALAKTDFDLISSDVMMPEMDGFELRERINAKPEWQKIPFLLLTARNLEADVLRGFRLGVDDYVTKPFRLPEYQARINNLLQNRATRTAALTETPPSLATPEDELVARAEALVRSRLADTTFTVEEMAHSLGHGQRHLSRLLSAATGLTPVRFILELRLQKARELLESRAYGTVAEVRYEIGIESASYFTRKFTERFGRNPREW